MSTTTARAQTSSPRSAPASWIPALLAIAATVPGIAARLSGAELPEPLLAALYGVAIIGAAFLLSWAAEAAQVDLSAGLAIAILALIAVLPEYAVDFVFATQGGQAHALYGEACVAAGDAGASPCALALANMTGANRILVGIGWSMVVLIAAYRLRRRAAVAAEVDRRRPGAGGRSGVQLSRAESVPVVFLLLASLYGLTLPFKDTVTLVDFAVLAGIFTAYVVRVARAPAGTPHLIGPSAWLGNLPRTRRRTGYVAFFAGAAAVILLVAEPFAEALVASGQAVGVSEFLLVQWVAPLASEAPELLVAGLFAWRLLTSEALATLISSKVNQWTLLVGTLPVVFSLAAGESVGLPVDDQQRYELLVTAAQSLFAVALVLRLSLSVPAALALLALFLAQYALSLVLSGAGVLLAISIVYLVLAVALFARSWRSLPQLLRDGFRNPVGSLVEPQKPSGRTH